MKIYKVSDLNLKDVFQKCQENNFDYRPIIIGNFIRNEIKYIGRVMKIESKRIK